MKKYIAYIIVLAAGLGLGYIFFSGDSSSDKTETTTAEKDQVYTCSMHPQVRKHEPGDCPICGMELIPVDQSGDSSEMGNAISMTDHAMALANIQTTTVGNGKASGNSMELSGKIKADENTSSVQPAYFSGRIEQLYIESEGEKISKGQLLAKIYAPKLVSAQQELLTAAENKDSQPALYKAVRNKLKNWKISEKQINQIEAFGDVKRNFPIYANTSGIVLEKNVSEGDYIKEGQTLYEIANLNQVWAVFDAYENQISQLKEGQSISISANSYPDKTWEAHISFIQPTLNDNQRTIKVRAELNNKNQELKPGMFVKAAVVSESDSDNKSLSIPKSAVLWTGERSVVYVKPDENKSMFELREVELGRENQTSYQILSGLKSGEKVVTKGTFTVDAAAQLQGKTSMMNQKSKQENQFSAKFQKQFKEALQTYLDLKDALVHSNSKKGQKTGKQLNEELMAMRHVSKDLMGDFENLKEIASKISNTDQLKKQRDYFIGLSERIIPIAERNNFETSLYIQKCPMANNSKGARWISREKEIFNPYFGEKMMKCGSTLDSIR